MGRDLTIILALSLCLNLATALTWNVCKNQPDGRRLAHPNDCNKFVLCRQHRVERILHCPLGLHFNQHQAICDLKERANCNMDKDLSPSREEKPSYNAEPSTGPSGTTCVNSGKCVGQPDGTMFADPDSNGYIVCQCQCQIVRPCAPGTKFSEFLKTCNHFNSGDNNGSSNNTDCNSPGQCRGQPNGTVFPNPLSDTGFIQCENQCPVKKVCKPGLIFNATTLSCVNTSNGGNGINCGSAGITCFSSGKCAGQVNGTILPASNNTSLILCLCECEIIRPCVSGAVFDKNSNVCVYVNGGNLDDGSKCDEDEVECSGLGKCIGQPDGAMFANLKSNTNYIECKCQCEVEKSCNPGFIFNANLQHCVHKSNEHGDTGSDIHDECSGIKCSNPGICIGQPEGALFAHPVVKTKYIECMCQCEQEKLCKRGLIFNATLNYCVHRIADHGDTEGDIDNNCGGIKCNNPGKCAGQKDGSIFPYPKMTTGYIECKCECEQQKSCAAGLVFSSTLNYCVRVHNGSDEGYTDNDCGAIKCRNPGRCAGERDGTIFAIPDRNTSFIECKCQCEQEIYCVSGLVFNEVLKTCAHIINGSDDHGETGGNTHGDCDRIKCNNPGICAGQKDGTIFANPKTNTGFIECDCQCEQQRSCVSGLIFNEKSMACVHVINGSDQHGEAGGYTDKDCTGIKCNKPGICAGQKNGAIFANPKTNTGFIECDCQCEQQRSCVSGLIFHENLKACVHVINGTDESGETGGNTDKDCSDITCNKPGICAGQKNGAIFANPKTNTGFIECDCQCEQQRSCVSGLIFHESLKACVHVINGSDEHGETGGNTDIDCSGIKCNKRGMCAGQKNGAIFANPKTNAGFIECKCECEQQRSCVSGLIFHESLKTCVHVINGSDEHGETGGHTDKDCTGIKCNKPGICAGQKNGAIFANPKTNTGFIECDCQCEQQRSCVSGLIFHESLKACVHVINGSDEHGETGGNTDIDCSGIKCNKRGMCAGQKNGAIFANPKTNAGFIECKCECEQQRSCVSGLIFHESLKACVHVINGSDEHGETGGNTGKDCTGIKCNKPGICAGQKNGAIFANPKTNTGFIECDCQCEQQRSCVSGLIFHENLKACVHVINGTDESGETGGNTDKDCSDITCNKPGICAGQKDGTIFANPKTNTGFIECDCQCEQQRSCVSGLIFNEKSMACVHVINGSDEHGETGGNTGKDCTGIKCNKPGICAGQKNGAIFANPKTNTGFIECKCECEQQRSCVSGLIFHESLKACVHVINGSDEHGETGGHTDKDCTGIKCNKPGICAGQKNGAIFANPKTNTGFIECDCQCEQQRSCVSGLNFDEKLMACVHVINGSDEHGETGGNTGKDCTGIKCNKPGICAGQKNGAIFANPNTNAGFIECKCECEQQRSCVSGLIFHESLKACVHVINGSDEHGETGGHTDKDCTGIKCNKPGICEGQKNGAIFANPKTNTGFIECDCQCEQQRSCVSGLIFNEKSMACVHVINGSDEHGETGGNTGKDCTGIKCNKRGICAGQKNGAIFANPNTNAGFIECKCECEQQRSCVSGLIFHESLKACVHVINGSDEHGETGGHNDKDCTGIKCNKPGICEGQKNGAIFANPKTNTGFIECDCQCEQQRSCVSGLIFNEKSMACVHVINGSDEHGETEGNTGKDCTGIKCNKPGICAGQKNGAIFANPKTNAGFIECDCQCEQQRSCVSGLNFDEKLMACVHVINGSNEHGETGETGGNTDKDCSDVICNRPGKCAGQKDGAVFDNPKTNSGFIECKCQCEEEKSCASGLIFNETLMSCIHMKDDNCHSCSNGDNGETEGNNDTGSLNIDCSGIECNNPGRCLGQVNGVIFPNPKSTTGFIECHCQCEEEKLCASGLIFHESLKACVHVLNEGESTESNNSSCTGDASCGNNSGSGEIGDNNDKDTTENECDAIKCKNSGKCAGQFDGTIFANTKSTTGFIECKCQCEQEKLCSSGLIFNENIKSCVHVNNEQDSNETHDSGCAGEQTCGSNNSGEIGSNNNESTTDTECVAIKCNNPGKCAGQKDGATFANPQKNTRFIECKCQCEQERSCVSGLIFHDILKTCVHVKNEDNGEQGNDNNNGCSTGQSCGSGSEETEGNTSESTIDNHCDALKCNKPGKCAGQSDGVIFANPKSVSGFIECKCQCEQEKSCAEGLIYHETIKSCVHVNSDSSSDNGCSGHQSCGNGDCNGGCESSKNICGYCKNPGKCLNQSDGTVYANSDLTGFFVCTCGCPVEWFCQAGTRYNESLKTCTLLQCQGTRERC